MVGSFREVALRVGDPRSNHDIDRTVGARRATLVAERAFAAW